MRTRQTLLFVPLLLVAACSSEHPLAGYWRPEGTVGALKVGIEFDGKSDRVMAHVDGPDGHGHVGGTYTFDPASKVVTVKAKLLGDGKADTWTGPLAGDQLALTGGADTLKFHKGGSAH